MKPPSKFEIMRVNRGFTDFVNEKARLMADIDCAELHVLRTLRKREAEEEYQRYDAIDEKTVSPEQFELRIKPVPAPAPWDRFAGEFAPELSPAPPPWWKRWSLIPRRPACR
jgi:hypothetical protein